MGVVNKIAGIADIACFAAGVRQFLALFCLLIAITLQPLYAQTPALMLGTEASALQLNASLAFLLDNTGQLTAEQIEKSSDLAFAPAAGLKPQLLETTALWLRFDAVISSPATHWRLMVPLPGVDDVMLSYRDTSGKWVRQQAGSSQAMSSWPQAGRYPVFSLAQEANQNAVRYYIRIHHSRVPFSTLPVVVSDMQLINSRQAEHLLLGIYFGLTALVILLALANAVAYRDAGFGTYAAYVAMFAGAQGTFTGVAGLYWWPHWPSLNNATIMLLPVLAAAAALWFVRTVATPRRFTRALDWMMLALMGSLVVVAVIDVVAPTLESFAMINILISASMAVLVMVLGVALFEGDRHTRWLALGFLPVLLATLLPLLRNMGAISSSFWTEYALMLGSALEIPILFYGLHRRVSQRREPAVRATALGITDPLTGLHSSRVLRSKLRQALATAERYQQPFALLLVNLTNQALLQSRHGRETGDRALVMAAARIRAVARPIDTVARAGDAKFALLLEGPISHRAATDVATKILASGLRLSNELPDSEILQFHIAVGHLGGASGVAPDESEACLLRMLQAVRDMDDGSGKAIRQVKL